MLLEESKRRQEELRRYIWDLSEQIMNTSQIREYAFKFKSLYSESFRHSYSEFFPIIVDISKEDNLGSLEFLSNNIDNLKQLIQDDFLTGEKEFRGLYKPILKLSDHINLEIARYIYFSSSEEKLLNIEKIQKTTQRDLQKATEQLNLAHDKIQSIQTELIAVLSIFAAIVLTFSGSMNFIGSSLSGVAKIPFYNAIFFISLCGFIVMNLIFSMMYFVSKITNRSIYVNCKTKDCTCGNNKTPICSSFNIFRKRLPYIFWLNMFIIAVMITSLLIIAFN